MITSYKESASQWTEEAVGHVLVEEDRDLAQGLAQAEEVTAETAKAATAIVPGTEEIGTDRCADPHRETSATFVRILDTGRPTALKGMVAVSEAVSASNAMNLATWPRTAERAARMTVGRARL